MFIFCKDMNFCRNPSRNSRNVFPALPGISGFEAAVKHPEKFEVAYKPPRGIVDKSGRDLSGDAFYIEVRTQEFEDIDDEVEISVQSGTEKLPGVSCIFPLHCRSLNYLKLMELDTAQRKGIDGVSLYEEHFPGLSGQAEYEMRPCIQPPFRRHPDSFRGTGEIVAAVYPFQGRVITGLYAVFNGHDRSPEFLFPDRTGPVRVGEQCAAPDIGDHIQLARIHAVRPGTYHDADYRRMGQGFEIQFPEFSDIGVSI